MILIDSNILIYSANEQHKNLRDLFKVQEASVSIISRLEVLGCHAITNKQITYFSSVLQVLNVAILDQLQNHKSENQK